MRLNTKTPARKRWTRLFAIVSKRQTRSIPSIEVKLDSFAFQVESGPTTESETNTSSQQKYEPYPTAVLVSQSFTFPGKDNTHTHTHTQDEG